MQTIVSAWFVRSCLLIMLLAMPLKMLNAGDKLNVFVSVLPQQLFAERIGGDKVAVSVMVKPGFSPATYEPSPRQIATLAKAQLYIRIGVPFEQAWLPRIKSVNPDMVLLDARDGLTLLELAEHAHHAHEESHGDGHGDRGDHDDHTADEETPELDPHLWTSPRLAIKMADQIKRQFVSLQPEHSTLFEANHASLVADLKALDEELSALFENGENSAAIPKKFLVFHPSWGYFANAYGLEQVAIESEGKEPGAKALKALITQAKEAGVKTIFVQPQFDQRAALQVARAIDGTVVALDPLAADYFANLRKAARLIAGISDDD